MFGLFGSKKGDRPTSIADIVGMPGAQAPTAEQVAALMMRMLPPRREPLVHGPEGCGALEEARREREDKIKKGAKK